MLNTVKLRLQFDNPTSGELISLLCRDSNLKKLTFLTACSDSLNCGGISLYQSWEQAVLADSLIMRYLNENERDALISFGNSLGTTDTSGQLLICDKCLQQFDDRYIKAQSERARLGKVYLSLGLTGAFTVLILLC